MFSRDSIRVVNWNKIDRGVLIWYFSLHLEYEKYTEEEENRDGEKENTGGHVGVK